jgi:hypothetical protein
MIKQLQLSMLKNFLRGNKLDCFLSGQHFQSSLTLSSKAGVYPQHGHALINIKMLVMNNRALSPT